MANWKYLDKYPSNLAKGLWIIKSVWTDWKLLLKTTLHRPVTILYPYENQWMPDNYRGRPALDFNKCVGCGMCERMCPTTGIKLIEVDDDNGKKVKRPLVNVGRCAFCGYCAEYCPTNAMTVSPEFELAEYSRYDLLYGPRRLKYDNVTPMMEVHYEVTLPSDIANGNGDRRVCPSDVDKPELDDKKCIGCKKCSKVCPVGAVTMVEKGVNEKGRPIVRPEFDNAKCISCSNCVNDCPKNALIIKEVF